MYYRLILPLFLSPPKGMNKFISEEVYKRLPPDKQLLYITI
jgi:hypothetical protein